MPRPTRIASAGATLALTVAPIPLPAWSQGATHGRTPDQHGHAGAPGNAGSARTVTRAGQVGARLTASAEQRERSASTKKPKAITAHLKRRPPPRPRAHVAGDPTNTISDFKFSPGSITVHVGDTITWINRGPSPHTATASDGGFDTGNLATGASASHTFTHAGTFAYICKIHPFMHGTVVVLATASSPAAPSAPGTAANGPRASRTSTAGLPSAQAPGTATESPTPILPVTGLSAPAMVALGLSLLALGRYLRRVPDMLS